MPRTTARSPTEMQGNLDKAEECYRESLEIAIKVKAINSLRISQEAFRGFLLKRYGGTIFVEVAKVYKELSGYDSAEHSEEQSIGKYCSPDRDKIVCALIYDLDEGPNGQSFVVPTERLVRRSL